MNLTYVIKYNDLFDDNRPNMQEVLSSIPSSFIISLMTIINDTLMIKGNSVDTHRFLLGNICVSLREEDMRMVMSRAKARFDSGYKLFGYPYTVELTNREFSNYKADNTENLRDDATDTLNILKAYLSLVDEMTEKALLEFNTAKNELKQEAPFLQLMWPHLIKQSEFINVPDVIYETQRGFALMEYLQSHPQYGAVAKAYFESLGCSSGYEYLSRFLAIAIPGMTREESDRPIDYFYRIRVSEKQPVLETLTIQPELIRTDKTKQFDYRGMKEKPLYKILPNEFIVPFWYYLYNALFNGVIFSFYRNSGISDSFSKKQTRKGQPAGFIGFKGTIGKEFSEQILFQSTMKKCFERDHETLVFFEDHNDFNPDCYYRRGKTIFLVEFKDNLLGSDIIQSGSYEEIRKAVDDKFVNPTSEKNGKVEDKGVYQLARNIEWLATGNEKLWSVDTLAKNKKLKLRNLSVYPIIVQTNPYFDVPGIGDYLNDKIEGRLNPVKDCFKSIEAFTIINFNYFFDKILLFADGKIHLEDELNYYHSTMRKRKQQAKKNGSLNDWINVFSPFSFIDSPGYKKDRSYRRNELLIETNKIWNINIPRDGASSKEIA